MPEEPEEHEDKGDKLPPRHKGKTWEKFTEAVELLLDAGADTTIGEQVGVCVARARSRLYHVSTQ